MSVDDSKHVEISIQNKSPPFAALECVKMTVSSIIVSILIMIAFTGISLKYCVLRLHPFINFTLLFLSLTFLAYLEALHYGVVSIEKWNLSLYANDFPRVAKLCRLVDTPQKVKKFLVGRQFFVILVVFLIAQITSFPYIPQNFENLPPLLITILLQTGLPGIALTLTFGQLASQIYIEEYTLQFLNIYGCEFVIRLSLAAEWIGVCNFSWLLYHTSSRLVCRDVIKAQTRMESDEGRATTQVIQDVIHPTEVNVWIDPDQISALTVEPTGEPTNWFDYVKYIWSTCATLGSCLVVGVGIINGYCVLPVPSGAAVLIFFCSLVILFYLEGLMIAITSTQYWNKETWKTAYPRAYKLHEIINRPNNVKRFIIGRQFCTLLVNFLLAQVLTFPYWPSDGYNPVLFYILVRSGLVGVLIVLSFGQLMPELLAQEFPLRFMDMFGSYSVGYISLVGDAVGVGHAAWAFFYATRRLLCGFTYEERNPPSISLVQSPELFAKTGSSNGDSADESGSWMTA